MGESGDNQNNSGDQWTCCNDAQTLFILLYIAFCALALITWKTLLAKPMRLMSTFLHEMSHACACWLTGGDVYNIEVYENEGGVTRYAGGCRCLIIPAGYCGVSVWSMIFVILSGGRKTATAAASVLTGALLLALCYSPNRTLVFLSLAYAIVTIICIVIEWKVYTPLLQFVILFYGVCVGIFAIADIKDDTIVRTVQNSDAYACYKEVWPCCVPKCIGLQWALFAITCQIGGIWIALAEMSDECEEKSWWGCLASGDGVDWGDEWDFEGFWEQASHIEWGGN
jgi:Peptidase M50B-like